MEMYWKGEQLTFKVHMKENQVLKYLNKGSAHTSACFKSIPHGVLRRLSMLTSITPENKDTPLNHLYPEHTRALEHAQLPVPRTYPTLQESLNEINERAQQCQNQTDTADTADEQREKNKRERDKKCSIFFCIGYISIWGHLPIHKGLKKLRDKHGLPG